MSLSGKGSRRDLTIFERPTMKLGTFRQQIGFTFFVASAFVSVIGDYVWAYHFAPYDRKFPTPSSVFELSLQISVVVVSITVGLFLLPTFAHTNFTIACPTVTDHCAAAVLGCIAQLAIFVSPHLSDRSNPFLAILFLAPIAAGAAFTRLRRRVQSPAERPGTL